MRQTEALAILNAGANVFLTGAPGAGKTYVLNEFIRQARADAPAWQSPRPQASPPRISTAKPSIRGVASAWPPP